MFTHQYLKNMVCLGSILGIFVYTPLGLTQTNIEPKEASSYGLASVKSHAILQIISIAHQDKNQFLTSDRSMTVKIKATPGVNASILLLADKYIIRETTAREISPGIYQATIDFDSNTEIVEGLIMARLQHGRQVVYKAENTPFSVTRVSPEGTCIMGGSQLIPRCNFTTFVPELGSIPLSFTSHSDGEKVDGKDLIIRGETRPNAKVSIRVSTFLPLMGDAVKLEGETLVNKTITADREGNFSFTIPQGNKTVSGLKYDIDAIAMVEDRTSRSVKLILQKN